MRILKKIIYGVIFCVSIIVLRDNVYADNNINIMKQPVPIIGQEGDEVTWTISAKGENLSYQWQYSADGGKTWNNFGGATTAKLTRTLKSIWNGWKVRCAIKDSGENTVISDEVTITVSNTVITKQPESRTGCEGDEVTWTISAKGENLSYQWQYSADGGKTWNNFGGATTAKLTRTLKSIWNGWKVRCAIKDSGENTVISDEVTITVSNTVITKQPESRTGCEGDEVTWTISAKGENLSYQWQYSADGGKTWNNFGGATTAKLTRTLKSIWNGWKVRCAIKDSGENTVISDEVTITVSNTVITKQPESRTGCEGDEVTWTISAKGENLSYQWQYSADGGKTWNNFGGATTAKLTRTLKGIWNGWKIRCVIRDKVNITIVSNNVNVIISERWELPIIKDTGAIPQCG